MVTDEQIKTAQEELDKDTNVISFEDAKKARLALGGKGPTDEPNWLKSLAVGTIFIAKERNPQMLPAWMGLQYAVDAITPEGNYILLTKPNTENIVDPFVFSRLWKLMEVLMTAEEFQYLAALKKQDLEQQQEETKE